MLPYSHISLVFGIFRTFYKGLPKWVHSVTFVTSSSETVGGLGGQLALKLFLVRAREPEMVTAAKTMRNFIFWGDLGTMLLILKKMFAKHLTKMLPFFTEACYAQK
jgi:hypothetical protein